MQLKPWIIIGTIVTLTACGQKGALFLDNNKSPSDKASKKQHHSTPLQQTGTIEQESSI